MDTAAKRNSAIACRRLPWFRRFAPIPDGSVDQADRQQLSYVYGGLLAEEPDTFVPGQPAWVQPQRGVAFSFPSRGITWVIRQGAGMNVLDNTVPVLTGYDAENRLYNFDFRLAPELTTGGMEIASAVITQVDGATLAITLNDIESPIVQIRVPERPSEEDDYVFKCVATLDVSPNVIVGYGKLRVEAVPEE